MGDLALGRTIRTLRLRQHWRQSDLADRAGCSQALVAQLEAGRIDSTTLRTLRAVMAPLGVRAELVPRWRGADIERLLDELRVPVAPVSDSPHVAPSASRMRRALSCAYGSLLERMPVTAVSATPSSARRATCV